MINVIKRDGRIKEFDKDKIKAAVLAAFKEVDGEVDSYALAKADNIASYIEEYAYKESPKKTLSIEEIQDLVERGLMSSKRKDVARAYITYRYERNRTRTWSNEMMLAAKEKLMGTNIVNQNANVDERSFGGRKGEFDSVVLKEFALANLISNKHRYNHEHNRVYIHDLDSYAIGNHNCMSMPLDKLLENGFTTRQTDIRPANSINTAFQLVAVLFQLQSLQQFGGVSATHLDWTMVPYVRKSFYKHYVDGLKYCEGFELISKPDIAIKDLSIDDPWYAKKVHEKAYRYAMDMTKKELQQAVEGMYHNLNTLQSRSGNQLEVAGL